MTPLRIRSRRKPRRFGRAAQSAKESQSFCINDILQKGASVNDRKQINLTNEIVSVKLL
jgi:hypothetical protein